MNEVKKYLKTYDYLEEKLDEYFGVEYAETEEEWKTRIDLFGGEESVWVYKSDNDLYYLEGTLDEAKREIIYLIIDSLPTKVQAFINYV